MRLSCIARADQIGSDPSALIVLPEYSELAEVKRAVAAHPLSIVVTAVIDGRCSRALLIHEGRNRVEYLKMGSDGRSTGTRRVPLSMPVYHARDICVGVIVCMDIQTPDLLFGVVAALKSSAATHKVLCIPADMGEEWFQGAEVTPPYEGVTVALCNHPTNHQYRCRSFIADKSRQKVVEQADTEAIYWTFD